MARATNDYTAPGWRGYLFEGAAIIFILLAGGIASSLIASNLEGKIAHHCAVDLQKVLQ